MKILFIIGSFRKNSFNRQLSEKALSLIGDRAEVIYYDYKDLPLINQDTEFPTHPEVKRLREAVKEVDGVWIFSPEYNWSYPGHLKNLLDWLSRPYEPGNYALGTAAKNTKVTVSNVAGLSGGKNSRAKLVELMEKISMDVMTEPNVGVSLNGEAFKTDMLSSDKDYQEELKNQVERFLDFLGR